MNDWPRPNKDTGIGVHDDANCGWKPNDFQAEIAKLKERGISWYLFFVCDEGKVDWARCLVDNDIMPILRIWPMSFPKMSFDIAHLLAYRDAGVKWFEVGNEPNLEGEWDGSLPHGRDAARKVAEKYAGIATTVRNAGMWPLTPALSPGGNIHHRAFFQWFMERIMELGGESVLWPGGIGLHCRPLGNPLDKGPNDYSVTAREWEWFDSIVQGHIGRSLPMANTEMGDQPDWLPRNGANYDWHFWADRNLQLWRWYDPQNPGYRYPDHMMCDCFWLYRDAGTWDHCGLVDNLCYERQTGEGRLTNLWLDMPYIIGWTREEDPKPPPPPPPPPELKIYDNDGNERDWAWVKAKYNVAIESHPLEWAYRVIELRERIGPSSVDVWVQDTDGSPWARATVAFHWPDGEHSGLTDGNGKTGFAYGPGAYYTPPTCGPHWVYVTDGASETVRCLGMLAGTNHAHLDITFRYQHEEPGPPPPPPPPERAMGFFVSSHQKQIDWSKIPNDYSYVFIRASAGLTPDIEFEPNVAGAEQHGFLWSPVHFLRSDMSSTKQAQIFVETIRETSPRLPVWLDVETWKGMPNLTQAQIMEFIAAFGDVLGCYTSVWEWNDKLGLGRDNLGLQPLWVADSTHPEAPQLPLAWQEWEFWQHNCGASIPGIEGVVCVDVFNGTAEELRAKYPKPEPPPPDPEEIIVAEALKLREEMRLPMPLNFKYPAVLREHGYSQGAGFGALIIDGKAWGWQIGFRLDGSSAVVYSPEDNYDATILVKLP